MFGIGCELRICSTFGRIRVGGGGVRCVERGVDIEGRVTQSNDIEWCKECKIDRSIVHRY